MDATPRLQLPYIAPQQAQKQVTYNQAMRALDLLVQPSVKSRTLAAPPLSPAEGDAYAVAPAATGAWAGRDGQLATLLDGVWSFRAAADGWQLYVEDSAELVIRQAGAWAPFVSNGGSAVAKFGINASADEVNRLALASEASLFTHDGAGPRLKLNKAAAADTGSVLFQTGLSGRAELGLAGDDDFHVKVSPDGSTWYEALGIARATGLVRLPRGQLAFPATQNPSSDPNTLDDYREGTFTPGIEFSGAAVGVAYSVQSGTYTKIGRHVHCRGRIALSSKGTSTGVPAINGFPFVSDAQRSTVTFGQFSGMSGISGIVHGQFQSSTLSALYHSTATGSAALADTNFTNTTNLIFSTSYDV